MSFLDDHVEKIVIAHTRSELAEGLLHLDGKLFSLRDYPMYRAVYDGKYKKRLLKTCRQVAKSTTLANFIITGSVAQPFYKTLYFSPTKEQTLKFSNLRVGKTINFSPMIKKHWLNEGSTNNVLTRAYSNGSENVFSYALDDADRIRGISADDMMVDEIQDILTDAVLPVARECMSASDYQHETYCGTPKTLDNGIESLWQVSTMSEWVMKCEGCNKFCFIDTEKAFGKLGPVCLKCGHYLNPRNGFWIDLKSDYVPTPGADPQPRTKGFHISQAIMPRNVPACWETSDPRHEKAKERWAEIMDKLCGPKPYHISKFRNEVVGVSDSQGRRLVTMDDLYGMCTAQATQMPIRPDNNYLRGIVKIGAGIDWSGGGETNTSRTVVWIWGVQTDRKLRCLYYRIFPGSHPIEELEQINQILSFYQPEVTVCDAGEGNVNTDWLRKKRNDYHKIMKVRYTQQASMIKWNEAGRYHSVNRTSAIDSFMSCLIRREAVFLNNHALMKPAFEDVCSEFEEVTGSGIKVWRHSLTQPDDCLHAMVFGRIATQIATGEVDLTGN